MDSLVVIIGIAIPIIAAIIGGVIQILPEILKYIKNKRSRPQATPIQKDVDTKLSVDAGTLRQSYLNWLCESVGQLTLSGVDPKAASDSETSLSLSAVYTALMTQSFEGDDEITIKRISAVEMLNRHSRLVLLGDPGSGKSTFVNFVILCLAGEALGKQDINLSLLTAPLPMNDNDDVLLSPTPLGDKQETIILSPSLLGKSIHAEPQSWDNGILLPVSITLRDFASRGLPPIGQPANAQHLWDFIVAELHTHALGAFAPHLKRELLEQGGQILFDGLDEVPESNLHRLQLKQAIEDFAAVFPKCRLLVTSRTYAYQKQDWHLRGFTDCELAGFDQVQIKTFIDQWYSHIAQLRGWDFQDAIGRATLLKQAITSTPRLCELAQRPLLLTLMTSLHAWRGGTLPENRWMLYSDTLELLLDWWERPKLKRSSSGEISVAQPSLIEWLKVDKARVHDLLTELAFKAHADQPDLVGTADVTEDALVGGLLRLSRNENANPALLIDYLSQRAGILVPRGAGIYTFPHRTFQEYLAACYLTKHDYPDRLVDLITVDINRWREVALLSAAKAAYGTQSSLWLLTDALCPREPDDTSTELEDAWGAHLVAQALAESLIPTQVSPRYENRFKRVQHWGVHILKQGLLPNIERSAIGNTLARLGDPRFDANYWFLPAEPLLGFVEIPAGAFLMGSDQKEDTQASEREMPQHKIFLPRYYIGRYAVTNAQFNEFVLAGGYAEERFWIDAIRRGLWKNGQIRRMFWDGGVQEFLYGDWTNHPHDFGVPFNLSNHPVVGLSWYEAIAYCRWLQENIIGLAQEIVNDQKTQLEAFSDSEKELWRGLLDGKWVVTLPSEAEWEKAARGTDGRIYPWGNESKPEFANFEQTGIGATSAVGCFPKGVSPYGILDMSGNAYDLTRSLWGADWQKADFNYPYQTENDRYTLNEPDQILRITRGGSWHSGVYRARCAYRNRYLPRYLNNSCGFRCCISSSFANNSEISIGN